MWWWRRVEQLRHGRNDLRTREWAKELYSMHSDAAANYRLNTMLIRALLNYHHGRTPGVGG